MSKQNKGGSGTPGVTPTKDITTQVSEASTLVGAVVGETNEVRENRGEQLINESPLFSNAFNFKRVPFAEIKEGDITFNGSADKPVYHLVVKDGFVIKYTASQGNRPALKVLELNGSQLREPIRQRGKMAERATPDPQFNSTWFNSDAYVGKDSVLVLKDTDEIRSLIKASLALAYRTKTVEKIKKDGADVPVETQVYVEHYDREITRLLIPVGYDTLESYAARLRAIVDATLPRVDFGEVPAPPVKAEKEKVEKPVVAKKVTKKEQKAIDAAKALEAQAAAPANQELAIHDAEYASLEPEAIPTV